MSPVVSVHFLLLFFYISSEKQEQALHLIDGRKSGQGGAKLLSLLHCPDSSQAQVRSLFSSLQVVQGLAECPERKGIFGPVLCIFYLQSPHCNC